MMHVPVLAVIAALATACASIGRPEGGPRDYDPPVFVNSRPAPGSVRFDGNRLTLFFDENVQLQDAFNKVVVSPVQLQPPQVSANGRRVTVELRDTLQPDVTYTIDFADAIKDLNEGNVLDGFAIDFSTGDSIDTLRISGMVLEARTLEPAQGMLVGVHSNLSDTALTKVPFERIARTNQYGQFTVRNLKPGTYRVYALNDLNRDYRWDRSEDVAMSEYTVSPSVENIMVTDTLISAEGLDSMVTRPGLKYLPNDVLLSWFNEGYKPQYLKDYKRLDRRRVSLDFAAPADTLPVIKIVDGAPGVGADIDTWAVGQINPTRDSLVYWIRDTTVLAADSLRLSVKYLRTDTTDQLSWQTDTLRFYFRDPDKKKKDKDKGKDKADSVRVDAAGVPQPDRLLAIKPVSAGQVHFAPLRIEIEQPIESFDQKGFHLEIKRDTVWEAMATGKFMPDSAQPLTRRRLDVDWEPGMSYRLTVDSTAVKSIYGEWNGPFRHEFTVRPLEEYANLYFNITGLESDSARVAERVVVELLDSGDKPVRTAAADDKGRAEFHWLDPSTYYARLFIDRNGNGVWDTGSVGEDRQPEEVYYFGKKLNVKKNWDIEQAWNIFELAVDAQKPQAIKKNKPKTTGKDRDRDRTDEEDVEYDEFGNPIDGYYDDPNDPSNINNRRPDRNNSRNSRNNRSNRGTGRYNSSVVR